ncbi:MAG: hypothetical protein AB7P03_20675 [Kofleriaceae bacterium]
MRSLSLGFAGLVVMAPAASADPQANPDPAAGHRCDVSIVRAPDAVRPIVERWVEDESRCTLSLQVRIVATADGLYVFATAPGGRVFEQLVADAQAAGAIVAGWAANEGESTAALAAPVVAPATPAMAPVVPAPPALAPEPLAPPGMASATPASPGPLLRVDASPMAKPSSGRRWLTLGALLKPYDQGGSGLRGELDLVAPGAWTIGLAASVSSSEAELMGFSAGTVRLTDLRALFQVGRASQHGRWQIRLGGGVGLVRTSIDGSVLGPERVEQVSGSGVSPTAEASLLVSRELGPTWALGAGALVTAFMQDWSGETAWVGRGSDVLLFGGVRRRL